MARDRDDDYDDEEYDDRPRRRRDEDDDYDDRAYRGNAAAGRRKLQTPGLMLALAAGIGLAISVAGLVVNVTNPAFGANLVHDNFTLPMLRGQPPGVERDRQIAEIERQKLEAQDVNPVSIGSGIIAILFNIASLLGGLAMRQASSRGLAMTGSIMAIIPWSGCCCLTMPIGIWALVVVLNEDAKAAFARSASSSR